MTRFGYWAALGACLASLAYAVPQLMQVAHLLPDPLDRILIFAPSLALAPLFVMTVAASAAEAVGVARPWRLAALGLAVMYATLVSSVYVTQLGVVIPAELAGKQGWTSHLACCAQHAPMTGFDLLGYTLMSLATLLLAPTYHKPWVRWMLAANGLLAPVIFLQLIWPDLIYPAALWLVVFPAAMALLAREMP